MFGLLNSKKNNDMEITTNPEILFSPDVIASEIKIHGLGLLDKADRIPMSPISRTSFEKYPADGLRFPNGDTKRTLEGGRVFYESADGQKEYSLNDRIKSVLDFGGMLHLKSGATYVIQDKMIIGLGIRNNILVPYRNIPKNKIENKFGKASKIEELYEGAHGQLWCTTYFYDNRSMTVYFIERDNEISHINFGLFPYSRDNQP
jgi:hypothetical protein